MAFVVDENDRRLEAKLFDSPKFLKAVSSGLAFRIARELSKKESFPRELAKKLGVHEQKIYYHVKRMEKAGIVKVNRKEERKGAVAKYYSLNAGALALLVGETWEKTMTKKKVPRFLSGFVDEGRADFLFVVGSPDPHGPYKARCLESAQQANLGLFLGSLCSEAGFETILDTELRENDKQNNLVVLGGPRVNLLSLEINEHLPIYFESDGDWSLVSKLSGKKYYGDEVGVVEKIKSPFDSEKSVLFLAGIRVDGTRSAVAALVKHMVEIEKGNSFDSKVKARVVSGVDISGRGRVDEAEFLE